jgi:hypothetical protein
LARSRRLPGFASNPPCLAAMFAEIAPQGKMTALALRAAAWRGSSPATRRKGGSTATACGHDEYARQNTGACCHCATVLPFMPQSKADRDFRLNFKAFAGLI